VPPDHDDPSLSQDHDDPSPGGRPAPTAADFDQAFTAAVASPGIRRVWALAQPGLPPQIEPTSFLTLGLLRHVAQALDLSPGQTLADLGCGRGGPGLWLAREADVSLVGVDFSPVAVGQAAHRASLFGLAGQARFVVGDLTQTGLPEASADAAVSIDAFRARLLPQRGLAVREFRGQGAGLVQAFLIEYRGPVAAQADLRERGELGREFLGRDQSLPGRHDAIGEPDRRCRTPRSSAGRDATRRAARLSKPPPRPAPRGLGATPPLRCGRSRHTPGVSSPPMDYIKCYVPF
jgi:SAM-dependent methyltransferase